MTAWIHYPDTWPAALLPWTLLALDGLARGPARRIRRERSRPSSSCSSADTPRRSSSWRSPARVLRGRAARRAGSRGARFGSRAWGRAAAAALLALGLTGAYTLPAALALARSERSVHVARAIASAHPTLSARELLAAADLLGRLAVLADPGGAGQSARPGQVRAVLLRGPRQRLRRRPRRGLRARELLPPARAALDRLGPRRAGRGSPLSALVSAAGLPPARHAGPAGDRAAPDDQPRELRRRAAPRVARGLGVRLRSARREPRGPRASASLSRSPGSVS